MEWNLRYVLKAIVAIATFALSAWLAFVGFYTNLVRIQSTLFSVSGVAFFLMVFGFIGAVSCIAVYRFPRTAGIAASLAMLAIAGVQIYDMAAVYRLEFLISIFKRLVLPLLLAAFVFTLFAIGPEDQSSATNDER